MDFDENEQNAENEEDEEDEEEKDDEEDFDVNLTEDLTKEELSKLDKQQEHSGEEDDDDIIIEEPTQETGIILRVYLLLSKVRALVKLSRKSNIVCLFIVQKAKELNFDVLNLIMDFHVRWNTSYLMLERFLKFKDIINSMTIKPEKIDGIKKDGIKKLKKLNVSSGEWELFEILVKILKPFFSATKLLSAKHYPTLSIGTIVKSKLLTFLDKTELSEEELERDIAEILKSKLVYHFDTKLNSSQRSFMLVSYASL